MEVPSSGYAIYSADGSVERVSYAKATLRPFAYYAGKFYGTRNQQLLAAESLDGPVRVVGYSPNGLEETLAADESGLYFFVPGPSLRVLRGEKVDNLGRGPEGPKAGPVDLCLTAKTVVWVERGGKAARRNYDGKVVRPAIWRSYVKEIRKDGAIGRLMAKGQRVTAITSAASVIYYADGMTIMCLSGGHEPAPVVRIPQQKPTEYVTALGADAQYLYFAVGEYMANRLNRIPIPACVFRRK